MAGDFVAAPYHLLIPPLASRGLLAVALLALTQDTAAPAKDWTALFDRTAGWTGGDGVYSVSLDGSDAWNRSDERADTLFWFSDTVVGELAPDGSRAPGWRIVNNSFARVTGSAPDAARIEFHVPRDASDAPLTALVPDPPRDDVVGERWYWPLDGFCDGTHVHLVAAVMARGDGPGIWGFRDVGTDALELALEPWPRLVRRTPLPLHRAADDTHGATLFGGALLDLTERSGAPQPDGFVYVYGTRQRGFTKDALVARVEPARFHEPDAWRYFDGESWSSDITRAAPLFDRATTEFSVSVWGERFVAVHQLDGLSPEIAVRFAPSPSGPFSEPHVVFTCPEPDAATKTFVYNAKAHPHLSPPGKLLVSYHVNTEDFFGAFARDGRLYRPRFVLVSPDV